MVTLIIKRATPLAATGTPDALTLALAGLGCEIGVTDASGNTVRVNKVDRVRMEGRFYMEANQEWNGFSNNYGSGQGNWTQGLGTASEPSTNWGAFGPFLRIGDRLRSMSFLTRANNADVGGFDIRGFSVTGPFNGTWNTTGTTVRTEIISEDSLSTSDGNAWASHVVSMDHQVTADSLFYLAVRPVGTPATRRYLYFTGMLEVEHLI